MNQKTKTILAMTLPLCGAAIWIPQLMGAGGEAKPMNTEEFPAEAEFAAAEFEPSAGTSADVARPARKNAAPAEQSLSESSAPSDEETSAAVDGDASPSARAFEAIERIESSRSATGMAELAALWEEDDESADEPSASSEASGARLDLFDDPSVDPLHVFLHENPLTAVLFGQNARVASLGSHLLREGDLLPQSLARVEKIAARHVILSREDEELRIDLPPFQSRPRVSDSESSETSESDEDDEALLFEREDSPVVSEVTSSQDSSSNGLDQ